VTARDLLVGHLPGGSETARVCAILGSRAQTLVDPPPGVLRYLFLGSCLYLGNLSQADKFGSFQAVDIVAARTDVPSGSAGAGSVSE
jgi:hypothetical protein